MMNTTVQGIGKYKGNRERVDVVIACFNDPGLYAQR